MAKMQKPTPPQNLDQFTDLAKELAEKVCRRIADELLARKWKLALLDVRYDKPGKSWLSKIRVVMPRNKRVSIHMNADIQLTLEALNAARRVLQKDKWYGLVMEIDSKHRCKISLNYDPSCSKDESFFAN
jgi:hypothetical protein